MSPTDAFAPAKVNLALHVTGQRADGYHLLDSLVVFADVGDRVRVTEARAMALTVTGPRAAGVPADARNLCWKASEWFGESVSIVLEKHLPAAAGIGGGSSDAAATLRAVADLRGRPVPSEGLERLGADVPVCMVGHAARMAGIGDVVHPLPPLALHAVLVNPGVDVSTPAVFKALTQKTNPPMAEMPAAAGGAGGFVDWLAAQRNDLQVPAVALQPVIGHVLAALEASPGARLVRMSGSGATCFALYDDSAEAEAAADGLRALHADWWVEPCTLR
ncbi:4-(cytidine 5'-diphospho)-2-C-methyl-D-erythritol kinase [Sagittula salina]|uniref:4-diphosphocytidyl-2-C-methyl-D-erythritol kinase n=1 Tax=Sagittula salina TaxID=2820268 RepID=A0A940S259_9RHOB|nr:4-(cytidine 5'-diphospho)-2-C-methyl-D-erythritol kinase [Sagittula salina]MBP0483767.1 4-(cytidine 5'-diphospho)-2-C-methyl-D-erythritol kinase [Sagittula salina]